MRLTPADGTPVRANRPPLGPQPRRSPRSAPCNLSVREPDGPGGGETSGVEIAVPATRVMLARVFSACLAGVDAALVRVEVDVSQGLPTFATVGLPDPAVRESRERVRTAIRNSGFAFPLERVTVNLAPADVRKEGVSFDLPIALGLLAATGAVKPDRLARLLVVGELALDGAIHPVRGVLPMALRASHAGLDGCLLAAGNTSEASVLEALAVYPVTSLAEAAAFLNEEHPIDRVRADPGQLLAVEPRTTTSTSAMCAARPTRSARWRSRRPAATTCCSSVRRGRARRSSRGGCRRSCRRSRWERRSR